MIWGILLTAVVTAILLLVAFLSGVGLAIHMAEHKVGHVMDIIAKPDFRPTGTVMGSMERMLRVLNFSPKRNLHAPIDS